MNINAAEVLTGPKTIHIANGGDDAAPGDLSNPLSTVGKAIQIASSMVWGQHPVEFVVADGEYLDEFLRFAMPQAARGKFTITGNVDHPENVVIGGLSEFLGGALLIQGVSLPDDATTVEGPAVLEMYRCKQGLGFKAQRQAYLRIVECTLGGNWGEGLLAQAGGYIQLEALHCDGASYTTAFAVARNAGYINVEFAPSGTAIGRRFLADAGHIYAFNRGRSALPGTLDGDEANGGLYVA